MRNIIPPYTINGFVDYDTIDWDKKAVDKKVVENKNCRNCGSSHTKSKDREIICSYCGTKY